MCLALDFVVLVLSEAVLSETVLVLDGIIRPTKPIKPDEFKVLL